MRIDGLHDADMIILWHVNHFCFHFSVIDATVLSGATYRAPYFLLEAAFSKVFQFPGNRSLARAGAFAYIRPFCLKGEIL
jgi:hypothetical protein